jgi:hypothetical protein
MAVNVPIHSFINVKIGPLREPNQLIAVSGLPFRKPTRFPRLQLPARFAAFGLSDIFVAIALGWPNVSTRSREPMPHYYFHFRTGSSIFEDEIGEVFAHDASALQQARRIALELARSGEPMNSAIIVTADDRQLFEVPLSENGS